MRTTTRRVFPLLSAAALALLMAAGCGGDSASEDTAGKDTADRSASVPELPDVQLNAQHVLIPFRGCEQAQGVERTRDEALKLAKEVAGKARSGADFDALAREYSEGPSAASGGHLGNFSPRQMVAQFSQAVLSMDIGGISDPVESQFGYHIILRREPEKVYNAAHILILHNESVPKPEGVDRTKEEAMVIAREVLKLVKEGQSFNMLATKHSNGPAAQRGGHMGNFTLSELPAYFADVGKEVEKLEIDEVSEPFETEVGIHLVKRQDLPRPPRTFAAKHILIQYKGATRAPSSIKRSRKEAMERIRLVQKKLKEGADFEELARDYSDGPTGPKGGDLGTFVETRMVPEFSKATAECEVGGYTDVVETPFGYHLIHRYK